MAHIFAEAIKSVTFLYVCCSRVIDFAHWIVGSHLLSKTVLVGTTEIENEWRLMINAESLELWAAVINGLVEISNVHISWKFNVILAIVCCFWVENTFFKCHLKLKKPLMFSRQIFHNLLLFRIEFRSFLWISTINRPLFIFSFLFFFKILHLIADFLTPCLLRFFYFLKTSWEMLS